MRREQLIAAVGYVPSRDVFRDKCARADIGALPYVDATYDQRTPADERAVSDGWSRFLGRWVVPRDRRIKLAVDKVPSNPAALPYSTVIAHVTSDHRVVTDNNVDPYPGPACHHNSCPNFTSGLDFDELLEL